MHMQPNYIRHCCVLIIPFILHSLQSRMNDFKRLALVIGNYDYEYMEQLKTPKNDCTAINHKLKDSLGFQVTSGINQTASELYSCITRFMKRVDNNLSDIVFYYSGHGCSISGKDYLIPVDADPSVPSVAKKTCVKLKTVIELLVNSRLTDEVPIIIILDCGRTSLLHERDEGGTHDNLIKDPNIFIMYSTESNHTAMDGDGDNGIFTECLLRYMDSDEDIENIYKNIQRDLFNISESKMNKQMPDRNSSLQKSYNFRTASQGSQKIDNLASFFSPRTQLRRC